jgi:phosphomannomutase/phosphoglucomutase
MAFSNRELTAELASRLGGAMGTILDSKSIVMTARDYRRDSRALKRSFTGGLMASGIEVIDLHAVPTSTLQFSVRRFGADAGVMFTQSHNLIGMVSIKFFDSTGIEFESEKTKRIVDIAETQKIRRVNPSDVGWLGIAEAMPIYDRALAGFFSDKSAVLKEAKLRVVIDCGCGPASLIVPDLLSELNCDVITLNAHRPKQPVNFPNPESLFRLRETVRTTGADLGISLDAEARHAVIIDSQGRIRTAEETASVNLHSRYELNPKATVVIGETVNPSVYTNLDKKIVFSPHGEPGGSARLIMNHRAIFGFNDTGLFFLPVFSPGSDAIVASLTVLTQMATEAVKSTDLYRKHKIYPQRQAEMTFPLNKMLPFFQSLLYNPPEGCFAIDTFIGIKLITADKEWVHYHLASDQDTLQIEIYDPKSNHRKQLELLAFARSVVEKFLSSN